MTSAGVGWEEAGLILEGQAHPSASGARASWERLPLPSAHPAAATSHRAAWLATCGRSSSRNTGLRHHNTLDSPSLSTRLTWLQGPTSSRVTLFLKQVANVTPSLPLEGSSDLVRHPSGLCSFLHLPGSLRILGANCASGSP